MRNAGVKDPAYDAARVPFSCPLGAAAVPDLAFVRRGEREDRTGACGESPASRVTPIPADGPVHFPCGRLHAPGAAGRILTSGRQRRRSGYPPSGIPHQGPRRRTWRDRTVPPCRRDGASGGSGSWPMDMRHDAGSCCRNSGWLTSIYNDISQLKTKDFLARTSPRLPPASESVVCEKTPPGNEKGPAMRALCVSRPLSDHAYPSFSFTSATDTRIPR